MLMLMTVLLMSGDDPLRVQTADAKLRVYELLAEAKRKRKPENKEELRGWAVAIRQEWFLTPQEFGERSSTRCTTGTWLWLRRGIARCSFPRKLGCSLR